MRYKKIADNYNDNYTNNIAHAQWTSLSISHAPNVRTAGRSVSWCAACGLSTDHVD